MKRRLRNREPSQASIRCGAGLFPDIPQFLETVLKYLAGMTQLSPTEKLE